MSSADTKKPKVGLALGGGAARGVAHIGLLKALEEYDLKPDYLSGTSIGALVAALYAFGMKIDDMRNMAKNMRWLDVSSFTISKYGLLSNKEIGNLIQREIGKVKFEDSPIPLAMIATDISTGERVVIKTGDISDAVMASSCLPGIFIPTTIEGRMLVDGGVVENVPISPLKEMGADIVIGIDLNGSRTYERPEGIIDVILNMIDIAIDTTTQFQTKEADILIRLELAQYSRTDAADAEELYAEGYRGGIHAIKRIQSELLDRKPTPLELLKQKFLQWTRADSSQ